MDRLFERLIIGVCSFAVGLLGALFVAAVVAPSPKELEERVAELEAEKEGWVSKFREDAREIAKRQNEISDLQKEKKKWASVGLEPGKTESDELWCARTMAAVDRGPENVDAATVEVYKHTLRRLVGLYQEDARTIANLAVFCQDDLAKNAVDETCLGVLNALLIMENPSNTSLAEMLAIWVVMRKQGMK